MLNFSSIMIGTHDPEKLAEFYEEVFGRPADWNEGTWYGWDVGNTHITIGEHSEVKGKAKEPQRLILNYETKAIKEDFEKIKKIKGAKVIAEPYELQGAWIATFADPDGNYFQLMTPWNN